MNGLTLKSSISPQAIITDPRVIAFAQNEVPETLILEKLQAGKADHYYAESRKYLRTGDAENCYDNFLKAIRYRNDIETNLFKRYFCTWLHLFLSGMKMLRSKNETLLAENNKQRKEILNLQEKISQLDRIVIEKRLSIRELKKRTSKGPNGDVATKRHHLIKRKRNM